MPFDDEWARIKTDAAAKESDSSTAVRLNEAKGGGMDPADPRYMPTPGEGMASDPDAKRKAAKYIEEELAPDTELAGVHAGNATETVTGSAPGGRTLPGPFVKPQVDTFMPGYVSGPGEFDGWAVKTGLNKALTQWSAQLANLVGRLNGEVSALRQARILYQGNDQLTLNGLTPHLTSPDVSWQPRSRIGDL